MYVALGFSGAQAEEKQFRPSGNRPENPGIFRFPQSSSPSMKIPFDTQGRGGVYVALGFFRSASGGKTIPPVRKSPGKSRDFQISAVLFPFHENPQIFMVRVKIPFDTQGRGGVYVALGFSGAQAQEKQFRPSGNRPENPQIFRFPQTSPSSMKIRRFPWRLPKDFDTQRLPSQMRREPSAWIGYPPTVRV